MVDARKVNLTVNDAAIRIRQLHDVLGWIRAMNRIAITYQNLRDSVQAEIDVHFHSIAEFEKAEERRKAEVSEDFTTSLP